jgi:hypothetical protein
MATEADVTAKELLDKKKRNNTRAVEGGVSYAVQPKATRDQNGTVVSSQ